MRLGWDLGDLYRDRMSLRGLWVRLRALPPDSPFHAAVSAAEENAKADARTADLDDALTRYRR